jgi:hypothetical protein
MIVSETIIEEAESASAEATNHGPTKPNKQKIPQTNTHTRTSSIFQTNAITKQYSYTPQKGM